MDFTSPYSIDLQLDSFSILIWRYFLSSAGTSSTDSPFSLISDTFESSKLSIDTIDSSLIDNWLASKFYRYNFSAFLFISYTFFSYSSSLWTAYSLYFIRESFMPLYEMLSIFYFIRLDCLAKSFFSAAIPFSGFLLNSSMIFGNCRFISTSVWLIGCFFKKISMFLFSSSKLKFLKFLCFSYPTSL